MPQITKIIYDRLTQPTIRLGVNSYISPAFGISVAVILVLFILVAIFAYRKYSANTAQKIVNKDYANVSRNKEPINITLFTVSWCPHCKSIQDEWSNFKSSYNNKTIDGYLIECTSVDCTDTDDAGVAAAMSKYNIHHFPTLYLGYKDKLVLFDSKITEAGLTEFIKAKITEFTV